MGTSYVEYKGFGFWTRDRYLASWIESILKDFEKRARLDSWHESLIVCWKIQIEIGGGCMTLGLDELLDTEERRCDMLTIADRVLPQLNDEARRTGELFIALLKQELRSTVDSPIDYL